MAQLESVMHHTHPCGCRFLLAFEEQRVKNPQGRGFVLPPGLEGVEPKFRVVTVAEAEDVVDAKKADPDWKDNVVPRRGQPGFMPQPDTGFCPVHAGMPYNRASYDAIVAYNAALVPPGDAIALVPPGG